MCSNTLTRSFFPIAIFSIRSKNVNNRQYLGIGAFQIPLRVQMNVLKKNKTIVENTTLI